MSYTQPYARRECIPQVMQYAIKEGLIDPEENPSALFMDLERFRATAKELQDAFPAELNICHAYAVKANPLAAVLRAALAEGCGAECASIVEVEHALAQGFAPNRVIFDSPCKTKKELLRCWSIGVLVNLDCMEEIENVAVILDEAEKTDPEIKSRARIGVRLNPQVGGGTIASTSTATKTSKFGVGVEDYHDDLLAAYKKYSWLTGLHCHVGSQGCAVQLLVDGVKCLVGLAEEINAAIGSKQVRLLDIGGGLPANYWGDEVSPTYGDYANQLKAEVPALFSGDYEIFTEMGRSMVAKSGFIGSRIEFTKMAGGKKISTVHCGSNMMLRTCYLPHQWVHDVTVLTADGSVKLQDEKDWHVQDVAGPLCFSADLLVVNRNMIDMEAGEHLVLHDCGGYTVGMYSRYNSRPCPVVYAYNGSDFPANPKLEVIKKRETLEQVLSFWE